MSTRTTNMPAALVDIDNILWNQTSVMYRKLKELYPSIPPSKTWGIDFYKQYMTDSEFKEFIKGIQLEQDKYKPFRDAQFFLEVIMFKLCYQVIVCSSRDEETRSVTERWLHDNKLSYDLLLFSESWDKTHFIKPYNVQLVVDDHPHMLALTKKKHKNVLLCTLNYSYNLHIPKITRANTLKELVAILGQLEMY